VPTGAKYSYEKVREFADLIAHKVNEKIPEIVSLEHFPEKRKNKIHIDISRNAIGQTVIAPYSLRSVPLASVSTPLEWSEVKHGLRPIQFTIKNIFKRIEEKGDLWKDVTKDGVDLEKAEKEIKEK
jgi:bifunctional non-homologous end joining protein LigD